jgi:hypothetical protein
MMIILCQWDFNEQIEKLARFYSIPAITVQEYSTPGYILYPVSKRRVKIATKEEPSSVSFLLSNFLEYQNTNSTRLFQFW